MVWIPDADERKEDNYENFTKNMEGKRTRRWLRTTWINQIRKDIEMTEETWEEIQENSKWVNRDGYSSL